MFFLYRKLPICNLSKLVKEIIPWSSENRVNFFAVDEIIQLVKIMQQHHYGTFIHAINVSRLSTMLALNLGLSSTEVLEISVGALLHDLGKCKIPVSVLDKPSRLNQEEWKLVKNHPREGLKLLVPYPWAKRILPIVAYHHERVDGCGYFGVGGDKLPLSVKIVCVADAFEAMLSSRPYQPARTLSQCWKELEQNSGSQFDGVLTVKFISLTSEKTLQFSLP